MLKRKTIVSKYVLKEFEKSNHPLSVNQIIENLNHKGISPNKTTVYRIIEKLLSKSIISEISVKNHSSVYEFTKDHHHHFICNECHTVFCLDQCHVKSHQINLDNLLPNKNFIIQSHDFNLYGICENCQIKIDK